jgi:hypothetical protein
MLDPNSATIGNKNIVISVNNATADTAGNVTLTPGDVGALPNTGGTMTGSITVSSNTTVGMRKESNDSVLNIIGGTAGGNAAMITLYGNDHASYGGSLYLYTYGDSGQNTFYINRSGHIVYNGKHIVRSVDGVNADVDGNVTLNALPTTGRGVMHGAIVSDYSILSRRPDDILYHYFFGGSEKSKGAYALLTGQEYSSYTYFEIGANKDGVGYNLRGKHTGELTWGGKNVFTEANSSVVVESWRADDGSSWYRKYSDGWVEQGGISNTSLINLKVSMEDDKYWVIVNPNIDSGASYAAHYWNIANKTTDTFQIGGTGYGDTGVVTSWIVIGKHYKE